MIADVPAKGISFHTSTESRKKGKTSSSYYVTKCMLELLTMEGRVSYP